MDFAFTSTEEAFRVRLRSLLQEHSSGRTSTEGELGRMLAERGWLTMAWPREYGGAGASHVEQLIFKEEMFQADSSFDGGGAGVNLVGPTVMVHGTEEQKRNHLPGIAAARVRWCQGFSEPGAGSDLAGLQTRAVRSGDDFSVTGQKIWTSNAHKADWMLLLARTDPGAPRHRGISAFLVDMKSPGITVRPLLQLTGDHGFNQVFFDNVRVPAGNLLGEENRGWYVATTTLDFERSGIERNLVAHRDLERLAAWIRMPRSAPALQMRPRAWRYQFADLRIQVEAGRWLARRVAWLQDRGDVPNTEASTSKAFNSEVGQRVSEFGVNLCGLAGQLRDGPHSAMEGMAAYRYLDARRLTVGQGTSEIQRNIIATRGLGLPRG